MNLALFDFDGTITTREMLPDFFRLAIPRRRRLAGQVLLAPLLEAALWPIVGALLLAPQRRAPNPDANRPL